MNPSAPGSGTLPAFHAASARATASFGWTSLRFMAADRCACQSQGSPGHIASCQRPKCGRRSTMNVSRAARACALVTGQAKSASEPG